MRPRLAVQATGTSNDIIKFFFCLTCGEIVGRYAWRATPSRATLASVIFVRRRGRRLLPDRRTILRADDMPDRAELDAYPIRGPEAVAVHSPAETLLATFSAGGAWKWVVA